jgi:diguanylate cyclase (GGDEF)-like protein/PAS domain S-box-containing protein
MSVFPAFLTRPRGALVLAGGAWAVAMGAVVWGQAPWLRAGAMLALGAVIALVAWATRHAVWTHLSRLREQHARWRLEAGVFTHAREGIMITDPLGRIVDVNAAFERLCGYRREQLVGQSPRLLDSGQHPPAFFEHQWAELQATGLWQGEVWDRHQSGSLFATQQTISAVRDAEGRVTHFISLMSDITRLKEQERRLEHSAHYDGLTGLPNRVLLADRLRQAMALAPRHGTRLAVAYLDLDGFKAVNDTHGHEVGDRLLVGLAGRMQQALREGDTLARLGGDEFVAVLQDLADMDACEPLLHRLLWAASVPYDVGELTLQVSASLGVTFYPQDEDVDSDQLLRQADQAMYAAKLQGKNRFVVFDNVRDRALRGHIATVEGMRQALGRQEMVLHYQPQVNLRTGEVVGLEALVRWQHPERGLLAPAEFLPAIHEHPLECSLGQWVLESVIAQRAAWGAQGLSLPISVNISARHLQQPNFIDQVEQILRSHPQVRPSDLVLEVLESSALEDLLGVSRTMADGERRGFRFALDDFGTGYASLTYLRRLPVAKLKIDQSFVRNLLDDPDDLAILQGVIGLAQAFGREVVAEGVETEAHGSALLWLGCDVAQGFGIAHPMPAEAVADWVRQWRAPRAWWRNAPD